MKKKKQQDDYGKLSIWIHSDEGRKFETPDLSNDSKFKLMCGRKVSSEQKNHGVSVSGLSLPCELNVFKGSVSRLGLLFVLET